MTKTISPPLARTFATAPDCNYQFLDQCGVLQSSYASGFLHALVDIIGSTNDRSTTSTIPVSFSVSDDYGDQSRGPVSPKDLFT